MKSSRILAAALVMAAGAALPLHAQGRIAVGQTVRGSLTSSSPTLDDGSHYAEYTVSGRSGQQVTITLRSSDFDAYLAVGRMAGKEFQSIETDDDGAGGTDAQVTLAFPSTGDFVIRANTLSDGETGAFTLEVAAGGGGGGSNGGGGSTSSGGVLGMLLDSTAAVMSRGGMTSRTPPQRGSLANGASQEITVQLAAASVLAIMGVCDESCSDLDLTVFGPNGAELGSDVLTDDAPIVRVDNARPGTYRIRVQMAACSAATCAYGVRVFAQ
jgi:hypothetical protein